MINTIQSSPAENTPYSSLLGENENVYVADQKLDNPVNDKLKVTFIEASYNGRSNKEIQNAIKNISINYSKSGSFGNHAKQVVYSFLDIDNNSVLDKKEIINEGNFHLTYDEDVDIIKRKKGIINTSFGFTNGLDNFAILNPNSKYFDKIGNILDKNLSYYTTPIFFSNDYAKNDRLIIKSLGNENQAVFKSNKFFSNTNAIYQVLNPELQKLFRSESIAAAFATKKSEIDRLNNLLNEKYNKTLNGVPSDISFNDEKTGDVYYKGALSKLSPTWTSALNNRSFTVAENGFLLDNGDISRGTSFSAPRISRIAYEVKKKYPFLSYHQVKQVILTTAYRGNLKYLDNEIGWGIANLQKAIKGPSDFNAGLIEEQKFFVGNLDRISDKQGNLYFYVDIPSGEYSFDNDISPSLTGSGNNKEVDIYTFNGIEQRLSSNNKAKKFNYSLPKVLDSEKNFYADIKTAGLRKDGNGTLILNGLQNYNDKTLLEQGTLVLNNDSKSTYEVYKDANLLIGKDSKKETIEVKNINNYGNVEFIHPKTIIYDFKGYDNSKTTINANAKIVANSFKSSQDITIKLAKEDNNSLENIISIKKNDLEEKIDKNDIKDLTLSNIYLNAEIKDDGKYIRIDAVPDGNLSGFKNISDLSLDQKRNIPSYSYNENKFFDEYLKNRDYKYELQNTRRIVSSKLGVDLLNLSGSDKETVKQTVFTDIYSNFFNSLLDSQSIRLNQKDALISNIDDKDSLSINTYHNTNIFKGENYTPFSKYTTVNSLNKKFNVNDNLVTNISASYEKDIYSFKDESKFNNNSYILGNDNKIKIGDNQFLISNYISLNHTKVNRKFLENSFVSNNITSLLFENTLTYARDFRIDNIDTVFTPFVSNNLSLLRVFEGEKEKGVHDNSLKVKIEDTFIVNNNIYLGINSISKISDKIRVDNSVKFDILTTTDKPTLNIQISDVKTEAVGKNLDRIKFNFNSKVNYKINDKANIDVKGNINSNLRLGLGLGVNILM